MLPIIGAAAKCGENGWKIKTQIDMSPWPFSSWKKEQKRMGGGGDGGGSVVYR